MIPLISAETASLLSTIPVVKRARNWRLYTIDGARLLDLYADGGRLVLGRRAGGAGKTAKEMIDQGLLSSFPTFWEKRLQSHIRAWLPAYAGAAFFPSEFEALVALAAMEEDFSSGLSNGTPLSESLSAFSKRLAVEVPFGEYKKAIMQTQGYPAFGGRYALAILPVASAWSFGVVLAKTGEDLQALALWARPEEKKDVSEIAAAWAFPIPAAQLAIGARSLADWAACAEKYGETLWAAVDPFIDSLFIRSGPWLYPAYPKTKHRDIFSACLGKGILISPDYDQPSLIPGEFDVGEISPLRLIKA